MHLIFAVADQETIVKKSIIGTSTRKSDISILCRARRKYERALNATKGSREDNTSVVNGSRKKAGIATEDLYEAEKDNVIVKAKDIVLPAPSRSGSFVYYLSINLATIVLSRPSNSTKKCMTNSSRNWKTGRTGRRALWKRFLIWYWQIYRRT